MAKVVKGGKRKIAQKKSAKQRANEFVIVGTYKDKQLAWIEKNGVYNYPVREGDEFNDDALRAVKELWLFADVKSTRHAFVVKGYVGKLTKKEFVAKYPSYKKPTHDAYYVFEVTKLDYEPTVNTEIVIARTADFGRRTAKVKKAIEQFKRDGEFAPLAAYLPKPLTQVPPKQLRVSEPLLQMDFSFVLQDGTIGRKRLFDALPSVVPVVYENNYGTLYQGDSLSWLKSLPDASVDMVFADPPYCIGKADWDCFRSREQYLHWCEQWVGEIARVLTDSGSCYICGFSEILSDVKYRVQGYFSGCRWLVWHYKNKANLGNDWGRSHESVVHFRKSTTVHLNIDDIRIPYSAHTLRYPSHPQASTSAYGAGKPFHDTWQPNEKGAKPKDVFDIPTTCNGMGEKTPHPTQKPEELVRKLVLASSQEGDVVLDPFSGSGTTAVVAQQLQRRWLACEREPEYNKWAMSRLGNIATHTIQQWVDFDRETSKRREALR